MYTLWDQQLRRRPSLPSRIFPLLSNNIMHKNLWLLAFYQHYCYYRLTITVVNYFRSFFLSTFTLALLFKKLAFKINLKKYQRSEQKKKRFCAYTERSLYAVECFTISEKSFLALKSSPVMACRICACAHSSGYVRSVPLVEGSTPVRTITPFFPIHFGPRVSCRFRQLLLFAGTH